MLFAVLGVETILAGAVAVTPRSDFPVYWLAGRAVREGRDIYGVAGPHGWQYVYPPPFAVAMVPLALLPQAWAMLVWFLLSALLTIWAVRMCVTMVRDRSSTAEDVLWFSALPGLLLIGFYASAITRGQASVLVLWLVVAAIFWERKGRSLAGAACLAGAILIKVFPVLLLAYFAWRRRWRFILATLALLAVGAFVLPGAALGVHRNWAYLRSWGTEVALPALESQPTPSEMALQKQLFDFHKVRDESLYAVLRRLTHTRRARDWAAGVVLAMAAAMWAVGRRTSSREGLVLSSAAIVWALLAPPVSWSHYFILLLLPLTALVALARRDEDVVVRRAAWAALALFGVGSTASVVLKGKLERYGIPCWAALFVWSVLMLAVARKKRLFGVRSPPDTSVQFS
jgi:alpha-1,2-mannosyltransferase